MGNNRTDTMRDRVGENRYKMWVLMRVDRRILAAAIAFIVFWVMIGLGVIGPAPMRRVVETSDGMWWVFSPMISGIITAVALVVSVNQLVLSQELGALGDQRERMEGSKKFRADVEKWLDPDIGPPDPASFMAAILNSMRSQANNLDGTSHDDTDVSLFTNELRDNARTVGKTLETAQFGTFDVIFATLNFNYSWKIYSARRLITERKASLREDSIAVLEDIVTLLEFFGIAREHVKTLYFQWELVNLSRAMLYASIPAIIVAMGMLLFVDPTGVGGATFGIDNLAWLVSLASTAVLAPFYILVSYILRIATVAKRTLAIGPFVLRETDTSDAFTLD